MDGFTFTSRYSYDPGSPKARQSKDDYKLLCGQARRGEEVYGEGRNRNAGSL